MIKRLVEKLYYKVFPDRVNEHELAQMPIVPVIKEERYRPEKIMAEVRIPLDLNSFSEHPIEYIKGCLARSLADNIKEHMTIVCENNPSDPHTLYYRGYIRYLREE